MKRILLVETDENGKNELYLAPVRASIIRSLAAESKWEFIELSELSVDEVVE